MKTCRQQEYVFLCLMFGLAIMTILVMPQTTMAKDVDQNRTRFYGWVESIPEGLHGTWIIGGQKVATNPQTEFDQEDGPLIVGGCAKVDIRNNLVHEIDSEPPGDCR